VSAYDAGHMGRNLASAKEAGSHCKVFLVAVAILLPLLLLACNADTARERTIVRDLAKFNALFATPEQGSEPAGLANTQVAAAKLVQQARPGYRILLRSFNIESEQADEHRQVSTVRYRADISIVENEAALYAATIQQTVALKQVGGKWLIVGGDQPRISNEVGRPGFTLMPNP
jgi:hypothetical protein